MTSARELASRLASLLRAEQVAMADFLVALADFDRRKLWLELGHASLFYFLHRELGLSRGAAHYRKTAARLLQRYPEMAEPLRDGRLCITSIVEVAKVITPENRCDVLPRFFHRSKREAMAVAAALNPAELVPRRDVVAPIPGVARIPSPAGIERAVPRSAEAPRDPGQEAVQPVELHPAGAEARPPGPPARFQNTTATPLTADLRRLHVTVSHRFLEKLEAARAALSHARPGADTEEILEAGLDLLLVQQARRKGLVARPRSAPRPGAGRRETAAAAAATASVPAQVRREVWIRDQGCCQWPLASGGICGSTLRVELDHEVPRARGGSSTAENLRLLCRVHNDLAARQAFGDAWMDLFTSAEGGA